MFMCFGCYFAGDFDKLVEEYTNDPVFCELMEGTVKSEDMKDIAVKYMNYKDFTDIIKVCHNEDCEDIFILWD